MPNHVTNDIYAHAGVLGRIRSAMCTEEGVDFNLITPMPPQLKAGSADIHLSELAGRFSGANPLSLSVLTGEQEVSGRIGSGVFEVEEIKEIVLLNLGSHPERFNDLRVHSGNIDALLLYIHCARKYRHATWYGWSMEHWGTKWGAYQSSDDGERIRFNTAWSAPNPIIHALAKLVPEHWVWRYADEDIGSNCGTWTCRDGTLEFSEPEDPESFALHVTGTSIDYLTW